MGSVESRDAGLCDPRRGWYSSAGGQLGYYWGRQKGCTEQRGAKLKIIMSDYNYEQIKKIIG